MTRAQLLVVVGALAAACSPSIELSCKRLCDTVADCISPPPSVQALVDCKNDCRRSDTAELRQVRDGVISDACYDARAEFTDCAAGVTCDELRASEVPAECVPASNAVDRTCPPPTSTTAITAGQLRG